MNYRILPAEGEQLVDGGARLFQFDNTFFQEEKTIDFLRLFQLGELQCERNYVINEHVQICSEISYIVSGSGWFFQNGKQTAVKKGDVLIIALARPIRLYRHPRRGYAFIIWVFRSIKRGWRRSLCQCQIFLRAVDCLPPTANSISQNPFTDC